MMKTEDINPTIDSEEKSRVSNGFDQIKELPV